MFVLLFDVNICVFELLARQTVNMNMDVRGNSNFLYLRVV